MKETNKKNILSGQKETELLKKISLSGLLILKTMYEKEKDTIFSRMAQEEEVVEIHRMQGKIYLLNSFIAKIDFIFKK